MNGAERQLFQIEIYFMDNCYTWAHVSFQSGVSPKWRWPHCPGDRAVNFFGLVTQALPMIWCMRASVVALLLLWTCCVCVVVIKLWWWLCDGRAVGYFKVELLFVVIWDTFVVHGKPFVSHFWNFFMSIVTLVCRIIFLSIFILAFETTSIYVTTHTLQMAFPIRTFQFECENVIVHFVVKLDGIFCEGVFFDQAFRYRCRFAIWNWLKDTFICLYVWALYALLIWYLTSRFCSLSGSVAHRAIKIYVNFLHSSTFVHMIRIKRERE